MGNGGQCPKEKRQAILGLIYCPKNFDKAILRLVNLLKSFRMAGLLLNFEIEMIREKRKAFRTYVTEETGLTSSLPLKSPNSHSPEFNSPTNIDKSQLSAFKIFECANLMNLFKQSISRFKGTNLPVYYRPQYDFSQKWEETSKTKYERNSNLLLSGNRLCYFIAILVMIHKIPLIWQLSIYKIFEMEQYSDGFLIGIVFLGIDLLLKVFLLQSQLSKNTQKMQSRGDLLNMELLNLIRGELITISIFVLDMAVPESGNYEIILDMMAIYFQFLRFLEIYSSITILLITYKYKNYVNLFNFISKIFVMLHFFAILVYSVTLLHPQKNWLLAIGQESSDPMTRYIYSLYFTGTTMFTVGYGDILPTNNLEILVIILVQIVGIVLIGYIVSEIGHTLSLMRQAREDFEQDIQNTDTVCEYYQLNQELKQRVRNYIVNHQLANEELNINEENHLLMKLNEQLRNEVKHANQLNIIKTSLFFICNWSKKMQRELAKKLEKCIFSPNERIVNKDRLYIVTKGKIDVYTEKKFGNKIYCKKHLQTVERDSCKQVFSNVYGYVSLFTGRLSRLTAVSKDFAICYALEFADILDIVRDDERDFQYYHERKARLELQRFPETYEIPDLINNRQHYSPTRWLILKKFKEEICTHQERFSIIRKNRRKRRILNRNKTQQIDQDEDSEVLFSQEELSQKQSNKNQKHLSKKTQNKSKLETSRSIVSFRSYRRRNYHKTMLQQRFQENQIKNIMNNCITRTSLFEVGKNYNRYFKKGNRDTVLRKINQYAIKDFNPINSKIMSLEWIDLIIFGNKIAQKKKTRQLMKT